MKIKCKCGKVAVWMYAPNDSDSYCCEECVPRGCSCMQEPIDGNRENKKESNWKREKDQLGREIPCIEWDYEKDGYKDE